MWNAQREHIPCRRRTLGGVHVTCQSPPTYLTWDTGVITPPSAWTSHGNTSLVDPRCERRNLCINRRYRWLSMLSCDLIDTTLVLLATLACAGIAHALRASLHTVHPQLVPPGWSAVCFRCPLYVPSLIQMSHCTASMALQIHSTPETPSKCLPP